MKATKYALGSIFLTPFGTKAEVIAINRQDGTYTLKVYATLSSTYTNILPEHSLDHNKLVYDPSRPDISKWNYRHSVSCTHEYKQYQGLTESYNYCVKCDHKE